MFDMVISVIVGNMFIGFMLLLAWSKAEADMKKPEKKEAKARLEWYKQHRAIAKYRK